MRWATGAARLVSAEGAALVETQSSALFGDVTTLARQMQEAIGQDATSLEEVMQRVQVLPPPPLPPLSSSPPLPTIPHSASLGRCVALAPGLELIITRNEMIHARMRLPQTHIFTSLAMGTPGPMQTHLKWHTCRFLSPWSACLPALLLR